MADRFVDFQRQPGCSTMPVPESGPSSSARGKVPSAPAHSQLDWVRRVGSGEVLQGRGRPRRIPLSEVRKHNRKDDCWIIIHGKVYDITPYMSYHPGGASELMRAAGDDATRLFTQIHPWVNLDFIVGKLMIGYVETPDLDSHRPGGLEMERAIRAASTTPAGGHAAAASGTGAEVGGVSRLTGAALGLSIAADGPVAPGGGSSAASRRRALDADAYKPFRLLLKKAIGRDAYLLRFILLPGEQLGMETGQHMLVRVKSRESSDSYERQYTPVSLPWETRQFDLWVRVYESGKVTPVLRDLRPGQVVEAKGPRGAFRYSKGTISVDNGESFQLVSHLILIAGGSGVTPLYQIMRAMTSKPGDATTAHLIYFNRDRASIMGEEDVQGLCGRHSARLRVTFVTSQPCADEGWNGVTGRASPDLLRTLIGEAAQRQAALWCGPPGFCTVVSAAVESLGFPANLRHEF